jgi:hypothetical protein
MDDLARQAMMEIRQRLIFPILTIGIAVAFVLALGETVVRLFVPAAYWTFRIAAADWQPDPEIGWIQKPNLDLVAYAADQGWTVDFRTNSDGLLPSSATRGKNPGTLRIMLFGDSTVLGRAVPENQRLHTRLQAGLRSVGIPVEVINAGVQGYSTDQELLYAQRLMPLYHPDVVLLIVCDNDFAANLDTTAYRISKPRFQVVEGKVVGLAKPDPIHLKIPKLENRMQIIQYSALYRVFQPTLLSVRLRLQAAGTAVSEGEAYFYKPEALRGQEFDVFEALLGEMAGTAQANRAVFWFSSHPHLEEVWDPYIAASEKRLGLHPGQWERHALDRRFKEIASRNSLNFCPVVDTFIRNQARGPFHLLPRDPHCNPAGYQLESEILTDCLKTDTRIQRHGS